MPIPADGRWPSNVKAVILTPEEKQLMAAGQNPAPAPPGTITVQHVIKNPVPSVAPEPPMPEQHAQEQNMTEVVGRAALITARKFNLPYVWRTDNKQPILLDEAEEVIRRNPGFVYFDFDQLESLVDIAYLETSDNAETEESVAALSESDPLPGVSEFTEATEMPVVKPLSEQGLPMLDQGPIPLPPQPAVVLNHHMVTEREQRAWGGVLTSPGQQVYVHPSGIIRVEVDGPIKLQKGMVGNTRILRITRATPKPVPIVKAQPIQPATTARTSAQVVYQQQNEKIPIPVPKQVEAFDESEF
jgi:hypothetical protein